ncbi:autophagy-related protein 22-like protein [Gigaspora rosea]|uniref:Autophagy-related protein n=1 Tax=Gigaspora rosea TaxID=44941 RepID=A0A397VP21_9GLOM|nr:autophagy-related protein 22-like protein [Gigaspora rosea]
MANTEVEIEYENETSNDQEAILAGITIEKQNNEPILSKKELYAWYLYAFACEVYAVVSLSSFIPLILEQFASEQGVLNINHEIACKNSTELKTIEEVRCVVNIFGLWVDTASFSLYTFSFSVILQAITAISIGATADHGAMRKTLLISFALVGSVSAMLFLLVTPPMFLLVAIIAIIGNVCFGASFVCFNGFLPVLARNHKDVRKIFDKIKSHIAEKKKLSNDQQISYFDDDNINDQNDQSTTELLLNDNNSDVILYNLLDNLAKTKEIISTHISARGFASGYFGGIILLCICFIISFSLHSSVFSLQIGVFLSGTWWFLFSLLVAKWLQPRPGPPLSLDERRKARWFDYVVYAWKKLWITISQARKLEMTFKFLIAWFFISDGYTTITSVSLLFAKTTLQVPAMGLIAISLIVPLAALFGTIIVPKFQSYFGLTTKQTVIILNILLLCIPFYGCLGFILPFGGLKSGTELYYLAVWFGIIIGSIQSYCRTLFSELVPRGRETEFFALYAVTDKGSSWLGPTLVAIITDITHEIRFGFVLLFFLILSPIPILLSLNVTKGKEDADKASNKQAIII